MIYRLALLFFYSCISVCLMSPVFADDSKTKMGGKVQTSSPNEKKVKKESLKEGVGPQGLHGCPAAVFPLDLRTIDGTNNNCLNPTWGSAPIEFLRLTAGGYADGKETPSGENRPPARAISNIVADQGDQDLAFYKKPKFSDYLWQWGQFLDHDLDLTPVVDPPEPFNINVPTGDKHFDPFGMGGKTISLNRSLYSVVDGVRQQVNHITAFIDASNVYGSDAPRAQALRTMDGTGRLKTSAGDLLPFNDQDPALPNAAPGGANPANFFLAGDFRTNEQVGLTAMHTLFVREHNYWADYFHNLDSSLDEDEIYERARAIVGAEMQHITYYEFLPLLLGQKALSPYRGYNSDVNPGISNEFATAAFRLGHTLLSPKLRRLNEQGKSIGDLPLRQAFFNPAEITANGIEPLLRGLASQAAQRFDIFIVDDVRNFLFGAPGSGGFDLASLNLQRGRDHGLPDYNQVRQDFGLYPMKDFNKINPDREIRDRLQAAYGSVNDMDLWISGLAEKPVPDAVVGETILVILKDQFERLRDGDRFWYESYLPKDLVKMVKKQTLAKVILRNTNIGQIQNNVFLVP